MKHPFYFLHAGVNTGELSEGKEFCVQSQWRLVIRVEIDTTLHMRFIFTLFKRNGDGFVLMNEQGYQFLECNKNYKESDEWCSDDHTTLHGDGDDDGGDANNHGKTIVNWVEWLWNPSDSFVICFCGPESAQRSKVFLSFWLYWAIKTLH